jgi:hypothetical protein
MAKFPPDDFDLPGANQGPQPGMQLPGPMDMADGDFQKGNKGKFIAIAAVVAALGGGLFFAMSTQGEEVAEITVQQAAAEMKNIFVMPKDQQIVEWRKWAAINGEQGGITEIRQEAIKQLAWAKDPEGVKLAADMLKSPTPKLQSMAATVLAHYGPEAGAPAKPALMEALKTAGPGSKPQIAWALVVLREPAAFGDILTLYRAGHLATLQRLGGGNAFDANRIVEMVPIEKVVELAGGSRRTQRSGRRRRSCSSCTSRSESTTAAAAASISCWA